MSVRSTDSRSDDRRPHWLLAFTALFSRSGSPTSAHRERCTRVGGTHDSVGATRHSRRGRDHERKSECWCQPVPSFRARKRGRSGVRGEERDYRFRVARVKQPAARSTPGQACDADAGPLPLPDLHARAVELGRRELPVVGRRLAVELAPHPRSIGRAGLPLRRREPGRDQQRRELLRAVAATACLGDVGRARRGP